jgi:hypothetical protein
MSARALINGRVWRDPEHRVSASGKPFGSASVRVGSGDAAVWWKVLAFGEAAIEELLSLRDGDALSATGEFKADIYDKGGEPRGEPHSLCRPSDGRIDAIPAGRPVDDEVPL